MNGRRRLVSSLLGVVLVAVPLSGCMLLPRSAEPLVPPGAVETASPAVPDPVPSTPTPSASTGDPGGDAAPDGSGDVIVCGTDPVDIVGDDRSVRVEGTCDLVRVTGSAVTVDASRAGIRTMEISGDGMRVDVGFLEAATIQGDDGTLSVASSISTLRIGGDRSTVTSTGDISSVEVRGEDNTVRADGRVSSVVLEGRGNSIG